VTAFTGVLALGVTAFTGVLALGVTALAGVVALSFATLVGDAGRDLLRDVLGVVGSDDILLVSKSITIGIIFSEDL